MVSQERIQKALEQIRKRSANHDYFFTNLSTPEWIDPLYKADMFSFPPPAEREGDTIIFSFWPESQYLSRMASLAPEKVLSVIEKIPETDNVRVHEDFANAALAMPGHLAAKWASHEIAWLNKQEYLYFVLPMRLGELVEHLARNGEIKPALKLAAALLRLRLSSNIPGEPRAFFDMWLYAEIAKKLSPILTRAGGIEALDLFCRLLQISLAGSSNQQEAAEDYSWIWRPAIEPDDQNHTYGDLREVLVDAVRDSGSILAASGVDEFKRVLDMLAKYPWTLFRRIKLHLLCEHWQNMTKEAELAAMDRSNFTDWRLHHEYARLLHKVFPNLSPEMKNQVFEWISSGPYPKEIEDNHDLRETQKAYWQVRWLAILQDVLPPEWKSVYERLVEQVGEPEHPEFTSYTTAWFWPTSPKTQQELDSMPVAEIAEFLRSWTPSHEWNGPTPEGLGRTLQAVVSAAPAKFVADLHHLRNIDPTYARAVVMGLTDAANRSEGLDWKPVADYLWWVVSQPRFIEGRTGGIHSGADPHWGWARKAAANLLSAGFVKNTITLALRKQVWDILHCIVQDPEPTPEDDAKSSMDPATQSINTTRGEAMHAVIRYALWVHQNSEAGTNAVGASLPSFDMMPEVRDVLELHLRPESDPSPAIRAVYGQWLPSLIFLDRRWISAHKDAIFPSEAKHLRDATWDTYISFCRLYVDVFDILRSEYATAIERLGEDSNKKKSVRDPASCLGEHLMALVARGILSFDDKSGLCRRFFEKAPDKVAAYTIAFVGRSLKSETQNVPDTIIERFRLFWDSLFATIKGSKTGHTETLRAFGWWFASGKFEHLWLIKNLQEVLRVAGSVEVDFLIIERLASLTDVPLPDILKVLKALVRRDQFGGLVLEGEKHVRLLLETALRDSEIAPDARQLIHELAARGHLQFRNLLMGEMPK